MFGDLSNPTRENVCVTEDGKILALSEKDGAFVFENGTWVKPSFSVLGSTIHDSRQVTDEEWASIQESLKVFASKSANQSHEINPALKQEFLKIAEEYNYPETIIKDILDEPELMQEIVDAKRRGCKPDRSWVQTALMYND